MPVFSKSSQLNTWQIKEIQHGCQNITVQQCILSYNHCPQFFRLTLAVKLAASVLIMLFLFCYIVNRSHLILHLSSNTKSKLISSCATPIGVPEWSSKCIHAKFEEKKKLVTHTHTQKKSNPKKSSLENNIFLIIQHPLLILDKSTSLHNRRYFRG